MSAHPATDGGAVGTERQHPVICAAPSCWEEGAPITVDGETEIEAILCNTHRKTFLGVST